VPLSCILFDNRSKSLAMATGRHLNQENPKRAIPQLSDFSEYRGNYDKEVKTVQLSVRKSSGRSQTRARGQCMVGCSDAPKKPKHGGRQLIVGRPRSGKDGREISILQPIAGKLQGFLSRGPTSLPQ